MPGYERFVEDLLGFLMMRLDEAGFAHLLTHEPKRMSAPCFLSPAHIDVPQWPCPPVRELALRFASDPEFSDDWGPGFALIAAGRLVGQPPYRTH